MLKRRIDLGVASAPGGRPFFISLSTEDHLARLLQGVGLWFDEPIAELEPTHFSCMQKGVATIRSLIEKRFQEPDRDEMMRLYFSADFHVNALGESESWAEFWSKTAWITMDHLSALAVCSFVIAQNKKTDDEVYQKLTDAFGSLVVVRASIESARKEPQKFHWKCGSDDPFDLDDALAMMYRSTPFEEAFSQDLLERLKLRITSA